MGGHSNTKSTPQQGTLTKVEALNFSTAQQTLHPEASFEVLNPEALIDHCASPTDSFDHFPFLSLPKDIRIMIYDVCLLRNRVIRLNRTQRGDELDLTVVILRVSKLIYQEALPVYLKNPFGYSVSASFNNPTIQNQIKIGPEEFIGKVTRLSIIIDHLRRTLPEYFFFGSWNLDISSFAHEDNKKTRATISWLVGILLRSGCLKQLRILVIPTYSSVTEEEDCKADIGDCEPVLEPFLSLKSLVKVSIEVPSILWEPLPRRIVSARGIESVKQNFLVAIQNNSNDKLSEVDFVYESQSESESEESDGEGDDSDDERYR